MNVGGGATGCSSTEETNEGEGDTGGKVGCWGERVTPAEDADADASATATPDTAASTCAKARPDPKGLRPTPMRMAFPKRSLARNRPAPTVPLRSAVETTPPLSCSASAAAPAARVCAESADGPDEP